MHCLTDIFVKVLQAHSRCIVSTRTPSGNTLLHIAAGFGELRLCKALLAHGAVVGDRGNRERKSPADIAKSRGHRAVADLAPNFVAKISAMT